jgi:uncharacterized membrane protein YsdA (DUF1294 family)
MKYALTFLLLLNVITFLTFGWDKRAARRNKQRVPEARLYGLTAFGGGVGAWSAIKVFRHKTIKKPFRWRLRMATVTSVVLWIAGYKLVGDSWG